MISPTMSDKLQYLSKHTSIANLSRTYDIPYRTLLATKNTGYIPDALTKSYKRLWSKESYATMRFIGLPTRQAGALRGGSLSRVKSAIDTTTALLDKWAAGATFIKFRTKKLNLRDREQRNFYETKRLQIMKSLAKNQTEVELLYSEDEKTRY